MNRFIKFLFCCVILALSACDLQPKIASIPDSVGEFISTRYPALLADPKTQPEIYNSAASDYGVYASPELYGNADVEDYILYASVDDYTLKPQQTKISQKSVAQQKITPAVPDDYLKIPVYRSPLNETNEIRVASGDTVYSLSHKHLMSVDEFSKLNNLSAPYKLSIGQKLKVPKPQDLRSVPVVVTSNKNEKSQPQKIEPVAVTKVELTEIKVGPGDTLYSISRKYSIPVNDLAVMNKLSAPFTLSLGQKLKVPKLKEISPVEIKTEPAKVAIVKKSGKYVGKPETIPIVKSAPVTKTKISSDPSKALPTIASRSSSKFSWPVRGNILSDFGAKSNGLYNDGINIGARQGTKVVASENGVVAYAGNELKGMGNLVIIQHSGGWMTVYAHMDNMLVRRGAKVRVGQQIGSVGQTGKVDRPQLHFEIRKGTKAYDPSRQLKR
ncbi:MAG TPA: LysM peptidoglycan-binding domain-containing M23 family metallopeptidase [Alphaproteobacteria bacterium]|nr:LysM peptidoglycan-binding domain-containing M23 family metallopeptidase [Alphaproteobacteria bacterium]